MNDAIEKVIRRMLPNIKVVEDQENKDEVSFDGDALNTWGVPDFGKTEVQDATCSTTSLSENYTIDDLYKAISDLVGNPLPQPKVQFWHPRVFVYKNPEYGEPSRITVAYTLTDKELGFAVAYCSPKDQFSKKRGREIAEERLIAGEGVVIPVRDSLTSADCRLLITNLVETGHLIAAPHFPENQKIIVSSLYY